MTERRFDWPFVVLASCFVIGGGYAAVRHRRPNQRIVTIFHAEGRRMLVEQFTRWRDNYQAKNGAVYERAIAPSRRVYPR